MNTERRHELEANSLVKGLNAWGDRLRPYTSALLLLVAALLGVYVIASLWNSYQATRDRAAWDDYQMAVLQGDVEQRALQRLAASEDHEGTDMQEWALMGWADNQLRRASQLYLTNREEAMERLTDVAGVYEQFAETGSNPEIRNRARLGLARVHEMKNNLQEARAQYARVEGALSEIAAQRIKALEPKSVEETAAWLATVELPKPTPPTGPGTPGARPGFEATAPATDSTDSTLQDILGSLEGSSDDPTRYGDVATPADAAATAPAESTAVPAATPAEASAEKPADPAATEPAATEPVAAEPAADAAPSETAETPAEEPPADQPAADATGKQ